MKGEGIALYVRYLKDCANSFIWINWNSTKSVWMELKKSRKKLYWVYCIGLQTLVKVIPVFCGRRSIGLVGLTRYMFQCVLGDFNLWNVDWDLIVGNSEAEDFLKTVLNNFLKKGIKDFPRRGNVLKLLLISKDDLARVVEVEGQFFFLINLYHNYILHLFFYCRNIIYVLKWCEMNKDHILWLISVWKSVLGFIHLSGVVQ